MTSTKAPRPLVAQAADADDLRELLAIVSSVLEAGRRWSAGPEERVRQGARVDAVRVALRSVLARPEVAVRHQVTALREVLARESDVQACGCGGKGCDTCRGTFLMVPAGQAVSDGEDDEHQEHDDEAPRNQI